MDGLACGCSLCVSGASAASSAGHPEKHHVTRLRPVEGLQAVFDERDLELSSALMGSEKKKQALLDRHDHA